MKVALTPTQLELCRWMAEKRQEECRKAGVEDKFIDKGNEDDAAYIGVIGEMAFGIFRNLCMDLTFEVRSGGHDFEDITGMKVDVKATRRLDGDLCVVYGKRNDPADYYVSVRALEDDEPEIVGFAWAEEVFQNSVPGKEDKPYFRIPANRLHPIQIYSPRRP